MNRYLPARTTKLDLVSQVKQDVLDGADLGGELLSSLAKAVMAMAVVGITATAAGNNRIFNAMGAVGSVACGSVVVEELRRKRRWDLLTMIEKATTEDARNAVIAALTERALQYHERGVTVAPSLAPSNLQAFEPIEVAAGSYEMAEVSDYEAEGAAYRAEIEPRPIHQTQVSPSTGLIPLRSVNLTAQNQKQAVRGSEIEPILYANSVMILALMGAGKTTLSAALIRERLRMGHTVLIADPHAKKNDYKPLDVKGRGKNYLEVEPLIAWYIGEVDRRYQQMATLDPEEYDWTDTPVTVVFEELAQYKEHINPDLWKALMKVVVADLRKANMFYVGISQGDTLEVLGGVSGFKDLMMKNAIIIRPNRKLNPKPTKPDGSDRYIPDGTATLTIDGHESSVRMPDLRSEGNPDFSDVVAPPATKQVEIADPDLWTDEPQGLPLALTSPRQLAPAHPHTSIAETSALAQNLPVVTRHTLRHPDFPGRQVTITEPELLELIQFRADLRVIVTEAVKRGGSVGGREIQQKAHHNNALKIDGNPMNAQQIRLLLSFLAAEYPRSFSLDNSTLTIIDPALMEILK